jgi:outer membrane protein OmpA-like peptidoglycan-associated protein
MKQLKCIAVLLSTLTMVLTSQAQIPLSEEFVVLKNETAINTKQLEYSPAFYKDGLVYISTTGAGPKYQVKDRKIDQNLMSIFRARRNSQGLLVEPAVFAEELLSLYHEGPLTFDRTNSTMYFTRNNTDKGKMRIRKLKIFSAELVGEKWQNIKELPFNSPDFETCHPAISVDDEVIFFASDREGGYGGMDIWMSRRDSTSWGAPINLGPVVNTAQNEVFPYVHADGTLYFASNGRGGQGQLDIFYTSPSDDDWSEPVNLGKPFNSGYDDFGLIVDRDNKNGYFSSNRPGGLGEDDIYNFYIEGEAGLAGQPGRKSKSKKLPLAVNAVDTETGLPIDSISISYIDPDELTLGEALRGKDGQAGILRLVPSADGQSYLLELGDKNSLQAGPDGKVLLPEGSVIVKVEKEGYQPQYVTISRDVLKDGLKVSLEKATNCIEIEIGVFAKVELKVPQSGVRIMFTELATQRQITVVTDERGMAKYCLPCGRNFNMQAFAGSQVSALKTISTIKCDSSARPHETIYLQSSGSLLVAGTVIQLPHIYFNFNDAALRPDARKDLDAVVALLENYPGLRIEIASHTDARGTARYNQALSQERSANVVQYLRDAGIDPGRLVAAGYGETRIRNRCVDGVKCTEAEHQLNRHTEMVILETEKSAADPSPAPENLASEEPSQPAMQDDNPSVAGVASVFYVIAGTFRSLANAESQLNHLRDLGVSSEIIQFENSKYQAVCIGKYEDGGQAKTFAESIRTQHQIDTYIRRENLPLR